MLLASSFIILKLLLCSALALSCNEQVTDSISRHHNRNVIFTPGATPIANLTISTCHRNTTFDTILTFLSDVGNVIGGPYDDVGGCRFHEIVILSNITKVSFPFALSRSYWIKVSGWNESGGNFELSARCDYALSATTKPTDLQFDITPIIHLVILGGCVLLCLRTSMSSLDNQEDMQAWLIQPHPCNSTFLSARPQSQISSTVERVPLLKLERLHSAERPSLQTPERWHWQDKKGKFHEFATEISEDIDSAPLNTSVARQIGNDTFGMRKDSASHGYRINLITMEKRPILRGHVRHQWCWVQDDVPTPYPKEIQDKLDAADVSYPISFTCEANGNQYKIWQSFQVNTRTNKRRPVEYKEVVVAGSMYYAGEIEEKESLPPYSVLDVQRMLDLEPGAVPSFWELSVGEQLFYDISRDGQLWRCVEAQFFGGDSRARRSEIVSIRLIQNRPLLGDYLACRLGLRRQLVDLNEKMLWHGTAGDKVKLIAQSSFNRDFAKRRAYGHGVYFAVNSRYSQSSKYSKPDHNGLQYLMWCSVICGKSIVGSREMRAEGRQFQTMVNSERNPTIYVVPKDNMAYPVAVVAFKRH